MSIRDYSELQSTQYPAGTATPVTVLQSASGILEAYGTTVPIDGTEGYVTGCLFKRTGGGVNDAIYVNQGSKSGCDFVVLNDVPEHSGTTTGRGPSPLIWNTCPVLNYMVNPQLGSYFFEDFHDGIVTIAAQSVSATAALGTIGDWAAFTLTGATITTLATDIHGVVILTVTTDDEADATISYPMNTEVAGMFKFTAGKKLWMEARVKVDNVTNTKTNTYVGFMQEARMATTEVIATAGTLPTVDRVGFAQLEADGDKWQTSHCKSAAAVVSATAGTIVISTWHKLGIYCDGTTAYYYIDGVQLADTALLATATFPTDEEMAFYFGINAASATTIVNSIDWVRIAQEY